MTTTWLLALAGGVLIGLSATMLLWLNGRIAGVSGIFDGVVFPHAGDVGWRAAFLVGLIAAAGLYMALVPGAPQPRAAADVRIGRALIGSGVVPRAASAHSAYT